MENESKKLRIVYMGTPDFAVEPLRHLVDGGYNVVGVVTVPDKPAGRGLKITQSAVKTYAQEKNIPILQPEKLRDPAWLEQFAALEPDLAIVVAFRMLPEVVWTLPKLGTFNLHASLLPRYRGAAPINWAIINGDSQTGITTFLLNHEIDCGAIIKTAIVDIEPTDSAGTLHDKLMYRGGDLVLQTVDELAAGTAKPQIQTGEASPAPKIFKETCKIDWCAPVDRINDLIRGLSPYPAAWCDLGDTTAKIFEARVETAAHGVTAGSVEPVDKKSFRIAASDGWVYPLSLQLAGKKRMSVEDFLRGNKL